MSDRFFEDFEVGEAFRSPGYTMTEGEIIDFALRYDPQHLHMDVEVARQSMYGGLIASGWHVGALAFRLFLQEKILGRNALGSPGLDEIRWHKPVRPGDTIYTEVSVTETRPSRSRSERGNVMLHWQVVNQRHEVVMSFRSIQMMQRRPAAAGDEPA